MENKIPDDFISDRWQLRSKRWIFKHHPETTSKVKLQNRQLKTTYMKLLCGILNTLYLKHPRDLSESELTKASEDLSDLTQVGCNVHWLRSTLDMVCLDRKIEHRATKARIEEIEQQVKKLELEMSDLKSELETVKAKLPTMS